MLGQLPVVELDAASGILTVSGYCQRPRPWVIRRCAELRRGLWQLRASGLDASPGRLRVATVRPRDWQESWKDHFPPQLIGRRLLIRPSWSRRRPRGRQVEVVLDPGLSFGTGHHATTRFCLRQLVALRPVFPTPHPRALDLGTGSGILAIAAAKLDYAPVQAIEIDPAALRVARDNVARNQVAARVRLLQADVARLPRSLGTYELVCANLLADLLLAHAARIARLLRPGGFVILSGVEVAEAHSVRAAYAAQELKLHDHCADEGWWSGTFALVHRPGAAARGRAGRGRVLMRRALASRSFAKNRAHRWP